MTRIPLMALGLIASCALLLGCAPGGGAPDMDKAALEDSLTQIDGVESADVGGYNTGVPGSFGLTVTLTVDDEGLESIGDVVTSAVDVVAADAPGYTQYRFEVAVHDADVLGGERIITLSDYQDQIPITVGDWSGSLFLTADELQQVAGS